MAELSQESESQEAEEPISLERLTRREAEVVRLAADGLPNSEIARRLGAAENTVKVHLYSAFKKLRISRRGALRRVVTKREASAPVSVVNELNNLLALIVSTAELLEDPSQAREGLAAIIREAALRGGELVDGLASSAPKATQDNRRSGCGRVLIVDDENQVRTTIGIHLESLGYAVKHAGSVEAALEVLGNASQPIDLLLADVIFPGSSNGFDLARRARLLRPKLPIVLMSGDPAGVSPSDWPDGEQPPILNKPFRRAELARALTATLASR